MTRTTRAGSRIVVACAAIGMLLAIAGPSRAAGAGWRLRPPVTSADLTTVQLIGASGWAAGSDGTILRTQDGGSTWTPQASDSAAWLSSLSFASAQVGWAVGAQTILATTDGGATWTRQSLPGGDVRAVAAVSPTRAWVAGGDGSQALVLSTTDGHTWSRQDAGNGSVLIDICFTDAQHGCAVGYDGEIVTTEDGGSTWLPRDAGCDATLTCVSFSDADNGWAAGILGSGMYASRAVLLSTSDGGSTWRRACTSSSTGTFVAVDKLDGRLGWAVGTYDGIRNAVMTTADAGSTWELQGVAASELGGIAMTDSTHGCVVGGGGAVLRTTDGGVSSDSAAPVSSVRGGGDGWRQRWVLRFVASDGAHGSGVACVQSSTAADAHWTTGRRRVLTSGDGHGYDGVHRVRYRAVDVAGNVEADRACIVRIDTRAPRVESAPSKTATAGATIRLHYRISDRGPCSGWARGMLSVIRKTADGREILVRAVRLPGRHTGVWRMVTIPGSLRAGKYLCSFSATDSAGNLGSGRGTLLAVK